MTIYWINTEAKALITIRRFFFQISNNNEGITNKTDNYRSILRLPFIHSSIPGTETLLF